MNCTVFNKKQGIMLSSNPKKSRKAARMTGQSALQQPDINRIELAQILRLSAPDRAPSFRQTFWASFAPQHANGNG